MNESLLSPNTIIDESWKAYRSYQKLKNVIERLHNECADTYPMLLFPTQVSDTLKVFIDDNQPMRVSSIMELITEHGSNAEDLKKYWELYKQKPFKPQRYYPEKKKAIKKEVDTYYPLERKDVYRPYGCFLVVLITVIIFIVLSFFDEMMLFLLLTTILPSFLYIIFSSRDSNNSKDIPGFYRETKYIRKRKSPKVIQEEEEKSIDAYKKQLAECDKWNSNIWPKLVVQREESYKKNLEEYEKSMLNWKQYWKRVPTLIESEYATAVSHFIWENINFQVDFSEEENPRRGAMENKFLLALKKCGVEKLKRDISVDEFYPDFSIIDDYYVVDIEIDEPYVYETGEPIHYIGCGDEERNETFQNLGVFVIRFTEDQIRHSMTKCADIVLCFQRFIETGEISHLEDALKKSEKIRQKRWTYNKAKIMADYRYRDK